ncbi:MAG: hypothetical protein ABI402_17300 [Ferruginibacter sp.]
MSTDLDILRGIESKLMGKLNLNPTFIQLESIRQAMKAFDNGGKDVDISTSITKEKVSSQIPSPNSNVLKSVRVPLAYDKNNLTWKDRVIFVVDSLGKPGVAEIITEIMRLENSRDKKFITKRVSVTITQLKGDEKIGSEKVDGKGKYYINKEI